MALLRRWKVWVMVVLGGIVVVLLGGWTAVGYASTKDIETPKYVVVEEKKGYEIREYAGYIRAEVTLEGAYRETLYDGFRKVADYIFGNNTGKSGIAMTSPVLQEQPESGGPSEKIAMTAPVLQEQPEKIAMTAPVLQGEGAEGRYTVAFVMPSSYTMDSLPKPNNAEVTLKEVPKQRYAVLKFGWYANEARAAKKIARLREYLERDGLKAAGPALVAQYDPPWTPPYMRKNEIQIPLP